MAFLSIQCLSFFLLASAFGSDLTCPTLFNYYPDQHDCTKFYRCVWGKAVSFNCPAGTRWSQDILTCDHAANVACTQEPATKIVYDEYTGNYKKTYDPQRKSPDFSVDQHKKDDRTITHPDYGIEKRPESEKKYPDYKTYPTDKEKSTQSPYYPDYETFPNKKHDYNSDYDNNDHPRHEYDEVDYGRYYPTLGYYYDNYRKFYPYPSYPYNQNTPSQYYNGYRDMSYKPYFKVNFDRYYTPYDTSPSYSESSYYGQQYKATPSWFPYNSAYHQSRYYPETYYKDTTYRRPEPRNDKWPSSDLFRAGYGYKRIYVKK